MGTDYTVFTNITFERLFARRGAGSEVQVLDAAGNLSITGITGLSNLTISGTLTSAAVTASGAVTSATVTATGAITGGSFSGGAFSGSTVTATGAISGASLSVTGTASANAVSSTTSVSGATLSSTGNTSAGGQFLAANGTVGAPSYAFTTETDCGFYRSGTGTSDWVADGVSVIRSQITSSRPTVVLNPGAAAQISDVISGVGNQQTRISGGTASNSGAAIFLNGATHASANAFDFQQSGTSVASISPAGLITLGASGGTQTHVVNGSLSVTGGSISGAIDIKAAGQVNNLGMTLSGGTFSITQANGSALSSGSPGSVGIPHSTSGQILVLKATANKSFIDDAGASDIVGEEFGKTTGVAWAQDYPFYIYAVNGDNSDSGLEFAISPNPSATVSPATTNIGYRGVPAATPSDKNFFFLTTTNVTTTHNAKPCVLIGGIRMRMSASDDWTVQSLSISSGDGIRQDPFVGKIFTFPTGQMGAVSGSHISASGGNPPTWASGTLAYFSIELNGWVRYTFFSTEGGNCTNGTTGNPVRAHLPVGINGGFYSTTASTYFLVGNFVQAASGNSLAVTLTEGNNFATLNIYNLLNLAASGFSNIADDISLQLIYKAF